MECIYLFNKYMQIIQCTEGTPGNKIENRPTQQKIKSVTNIKLIQKRRDTGLGGAVPERACRDIFVILQIVLMELLIRFRNFLFLTHCSASTVIKQKYLVGTNKGIAEHINKRN